MKSLTALWKVIAEELGDGCGVSTHRDFKTVTDRTEREGLSFMTITLPDFGKDFDEALSQAKVSHSHFSGFRKRGGLPLFLGGFLELVFSPGDLCLRNDYSIDAVRSIRQLTRVFSKLERDCSRPRIAKAYRDYVAVDREVGEHAVPEETLMEFLRASRALFGRVLSQMDDAVARGDILPAHGPGNTADRLSGNAKWDQSEWTSRLDKVFPYVEYLLASPSFYGEEERGAIHFREPGDELPTRVIHVPKTLKTPRIIALEPTAMQYAQQGLMIPLVKALEADKLASQWVGFTDQEPNQLLAKVGSVQGELATLDLREASDRVSVKHVEVLLRGFSHLSDAVFACRSTRADVDGHGVIPLSKFASMGSALTFPIEAMVFATCVLMGIEKSRGRKIRSPHELKKLRGLVRVYGDDIICPTDDTPDVVSTLESFGFKVNEHKSFWSGNFRESCGKEYFDGQDVSIVKVKQVPPDYIPNLSKLTSARKVKDLVSTVALRNRLYQAGLRRTADHLDKTLVRSLDGIYPYVGPDFSGLGRVHDWKRSSDRLHDDYHYPACRAWKVRYRYRVNIPSGHGALLKFFLKQSLQPADRNHLERSGRPAGANIKLRLLRNV